MLRRLALLLLTLSILALAALAGCGGTKDFIFDAGGIDAGPVDAGPCDVYAQTNCPANLKCTIIPDGTPVCGNKGSGDDYDACSGDQECKPGTACVDLTFSGFLSGKHCYPFCDIAAQPDGGTTCPGSGASCLKLTFPDGGLSIPEGFCDIPGN